MLGEIKYTPENKPTSEELKKLRAKKEVSPVNETKEVEKLRKTKDRKEEGKGEHIDIEA